MHPMFNLVDRHAGFVGVEDGFLWEDFAQPLFKGLQGLVLLLARALQRAFTDGIAEHLLTHLTDPLAGSLLDVVEVSEQSTEVFPILNWGADFGGEGSCAGALAAGALFDFGAMLGTFQFQGRQIENLAPLIVDGGLLGEILTALALQQRVNLDLLRLVAPGQGATAMARLAAGLASGLFAQALGFRLFRTVGGRGTRAVAAVLSGGEIGRAHVGLEFEGIIDQRVRVSLPPSPKLFPAFSDRVVGARRHGRDKGKRP